MATGKIDVAFTGYGKVAELGHAPAVRAIPALHVVAVAEPNPLRQIKALQDFPAARIYTRIEDLLEHEACIDMMIVASPPVDHRAAILACAEASIGTVVCEKPLVLTEAEFIHTLSSLSNTRLYSVDNYAYAPVVLFMRDRALQWIGDISQIKQVVHRCGHARGCQEWRPNWRQEVTVSGGGILIDSGWHCFYLLHELLNGLPLDIELVRLNYVAKEVEQEALCVLGSKQITATICLSWLMANRMNRIEISGQAGSLQVCGNQLLLHVRGKPVRSQTFEESLSEEGYHPQWYRRMYDAILRAVRYTDDVFFATNQKVARDCLGWIAKCYRLSRKACQE